MKIRAKSGALIGISWYEPSLRVLAKEEWLASQLVIHPLLKNKEDVPIYPGLEELISHNWGEIKKKNPKAYPGPTVRLANYHIGKDNLVLDILPSDYAQGQFLTWLGVAMVPVTSDGLVVMQTQVDGIAASIGAGTRVPGCTPPHADFIPHIIKEMKEEFNVDIQENQLTVLGLLEVLPPIAKRHNGIIVKIKLKETFAELKERWQTAEDKWEGDLFPLKLTKEDTVSVVLDQFYAAASRLILAIIAESEFGNTEIEIFV